MFNFISSCTYLILQSIKHIFKMLARRLSQVFNLTVFVVFGLACQGIDSQTIPPCGFKDIVPSRSDPYVIPAISDNLDADKTNYIWKHPLYGNINRTAGVGAQYVSAFTTTDEYRIAPNELTKSYTRNFGRVLNRTVNVYCNDDVKKVHPFYFRIPFEDMTPPTFLKESYNIVASTDWDKTLPISGGHFIIATDNAFEIKESPDFIKFTTSSPDYIRIESVPLWVDQQENYSYRLDLYFQDDVTLKIGVRTVKVIAQDEFSSSDTTIRIEVK